MLLPQSLSGAIKKRGDYAPFKELGKNGPIKLGGAVETTAGKLPFVSIIHVAGISMLWISSERSVRASVKNAMKIVMAQEYQPVAFPLIGAGTGGGKDDAVLKWMHSELKKINCEGEVRIVRDNRHSS